jgi:hypothetical protein
MLMKHAKIPMNFEHYANPMVHPVNGRTITSYKKLMHDPAMAKIWQTTFGKDFWGNGPWLQQDRAERHKRYVCHDA